jgi:deoxycytidylate deaminase
MVGPCARRVVTATVVKGDAKYVSTNFCRNAQEICPRGDAPSMVGYDKCRDICDQPGHAETNALMLAGEDACGSTLYLEGHTFICDNCLKAIKEAGVKNMVIRQKPAEGK